MSSVCILSTVDEKRMSMVSLYTQYFEKNGIEYDLIFLNKGNKTTTIKAKTTYSYSLNTNSSMLKKVYLLFKFFKYSKKIINKNKYDLIIVWNELTSFVFGLYLANKQNHKYIINIRDYHFFKNPLVNYVISSSIKNSYLSTVSSPKLIDYFSKHTDKIIPIYGYNEVLVRNYKYKKNNDNTIRIGYIGQIRWIDNLYNLLRMIGNDSRYQLVLAGRGALELSKDKKICNYNNVVFFGEFSPSDTVKYLNEIDVLYNIYGNDNIHKTTAVSIKLFYATALNIPIITSPKTYTNQLAKELGIGYTFYSNQLTFPNDFYKWFFERDKYDSKTKCNDFIINITTQQNRVYTLLNKFFIRNEVES